MQVQTVTLVYAYLRNEDRGGGRDFYLCYYYI